jgi:enoyl-[acyl-carrier protein] reductase I
MQVSAYSLRVLADVAQPLMEKAGGGSIVGLDFDNSTQAFPAYDWMGVAKAALAATSRYLARDLGPKNIRVNLVAAGPVKTVAATSIPGFERFESAWQERSPLGWDAADPEPAARGVIALLSDWFPATTGEVVHVDGGFHAIGA